MKKKVLSWICVFIMAVSFQLMSFADTGVTFIQLDKDTYNVNEQICLSVFNADSDISIEIVWEDTGNIIYKSDSNSTRNTIEIDAPANSGKYICNVYIGSERYSKSFNVVGENKLPVLSGKITENDSGNTIGIQLDWTDTQKNSRYQLKRTDNTMEEKEYTDISTNYFIDASIKPNRTYRYTVYNGSEKSNEIIINTSEFNQSSFALSHNTKCIKLTVNSPLIYNNGDEFMIDSDNSVVPEIINDRVLLPIRAVVKSMGGNVSWEESDRSVILSALNNEVKIPIDSKTVYVNGAEKQFDAPAVIKNDRTLVPIRHMEFLGCEVEWNSKNKTVIIKYPEY